MEADKTELEQLKEAQQELGERLQRSQEENRKQFSEMIDMMVKLMRNKVIGEGGSSSLDNNTQIASGTQSKHEVGINPYGLPVPPILQGNQPFASGASLKIGKVEEVPDLDAMKEKEHSNTVEYSKVQRKLELMEETFKAMEGSEGYGIVDDAELSLVSGLVLPQKFKMPEFQKYDGTTCPKMHVKMYYRKMTVHVDNDKLMIHCFQDSLTGSAARWYTNLNRSNIKSWKDLSRAFLLQYRHMNEMAPDRMSLQNLEKKPTESFKEYANRWRDISIQVDPPLNDKERASLFINTLKPPYHDRLVGNATTNFANIVFAGEMVERAIKSGKIESGEGSKKNQPKKKEEVQAVFGGNPQFPNAYSAYSNPYPAPYQYPSQVNNLNPGTTSYQPSDTAKNLHNSFQTNTQTNQRYPGKEKPKFDPIPVSYTELFPKLVDNRLLAPTPVNPIKPPYPSWYDANAKCAYHCNVAGHSTENCTALKQKVQNLVRTGYLDFTKIVGPNVAGNPLPNHTGNNVNAVIEDTGCKIKTRVEDVKTPMLVVYHELLKAGFLKINDIKGIGSSCAYCDQPIEHAIQQCARFKEMVQWLMDSKVIEFYEEGEKSINVITQTGFSEVAESGKPKPLMIYYQEEVKPVPQTKLAVEVPTPFNYKSDKAVPWNYNCNYVQQGGIGEISGVGGMTRSGRVYTPQMTETAIQKKASENLEKRDNNGLETQETATALEPPKRQIPKELADEFLKFIKHSEYSVVEQLSKTPAKISLLSLLMDSEPHRNALLRALNEAFVPRSVSVEKVDQLIGNITASSMIAFSDDEIPPEGRGSTKALYITVKCKDFSLSRALIDNGSSLNVLPLAILEKLPIDASYLKPSQLVVKAFDGTKRDVRGNIEIPIQIGPCTFSIEFQVMDINPYYSCLLGRPWIHTAGAVPSSLHQKVKFVIKDQLITIRAEEDLVVASTSSTPYIELGEETIESSFQSFEIAHATYVSERSYVPKPKWSKSTWAGLWDTVGKGAKPEYGLGKELQGMRKAVTVVPKYDRFGLGYKPDAKEKRKYNEKKRVGRIAKLEGRHEEEEPMVIPHLLETFCSGGHVYPELMKSLEEKVHQMTINAIIQDVYEDEVNALVRPCPEELKNWTAVEVPVVFKNISM